MGAIPPDTVSDLFELRQLMEPVAAARAASRREPGALHRIRGCLKALEAAPPFSDAFHAADLAFHLAVCAASGNDLVARLSRILMPLCDFDRALAPPRQRQRQPAAAPGTARRDRARRRRRGPGHRRRDRPRDPARVAGPPATSLIGRRKSLAPDVLLEAWAEAVRQARLYPNAGVHGHLAHEVGRQIVSGAIGQGDLLPRESELSEHYGVSRQAVREALKVLAAKGLVFSRRRSGTRVLPWASWNLLDPDVVAWFPPHGIPTDFLRDLFELRKAIEPVASYRAAANGDSTAIAEIGEALGRMIAAEKPSEAFFEADAAFHGAILDASGNTLFEQLSRAIGPVMRSSFQLHFIGVITSLANSALVEAAVKEFDLERHAAVFEAIRDHDPDAGQARLRDAPLPDRDRDRLRRQEPRGLRPGFVQDGSPRPASRRATVAVVEWPGRRGSSSTRPPRALTKSAPTTSASA